MLKPVHGVGDDDDDVNGCNDDMIVDKTLCNHCFNGNKHETGWINAGMRNKRLSGCRYFSLSFCRLWALTGRWKKNRARAAATTKRRERKD